MEKKDGFDYRWGMAKALTFEPYIPPGRKSYSIRFVHPLKSKQVTRGLATTDFLEAQYLSVQLKALCVRKELWVKNSPRMELKLYDFRVRKAFFGKDPLAQDRTQGATPQTSYLLGVAVERARFFSSIRPLLLDALPKPIVQSELISRFFQAHENGLNRIAEDLRSLESLKARKASRDELEAASQLLASHVLSSMEISNSLVIGLRPVLDEIPGWKHFLNEHASSLRKLYELLVPMLDQRPSFSPQYIEI